MKKYYYLMEYILVANKIGTRSSQIDTSMFYRLNVKRLALLLIVSN